MHESSYFLFTFYHVFLLKTTVSGYYFFSLHIADQDNLLFKKWQHIFVIKTINIPLKCTAPKVKWSAPKVKWSAPKVKWSTPKVKW